MRRVIQFSAHCSRSSNAIAFRPALGRRGAISSVPPGPRPVGPSVSGAGPQQLGRIVRPAPAVARRRRSPAPPPIRPRPAAGAARRRSRRARAAPTASRWQRLSTVAGRRADRDRHQHDQHARPGSSSVLSSALAGIGIQQVGRMNDRHGRRRAVRGERQGLVQRADLIDPDLTANPPPAPPTRGPDAPGAQHPLAFATLARRASLVPGAQQHLRRASSASCTPPPPGAS